VVCDNTAIPGVYTIMLWSTTSSLFDGLTGFTSYSTPISGWQLYVKQASGLAAGITMKAGSKFDVRIYSKTISAASLARYYDDIQNHSGSMFLPGFKS
jgi:hypothetical protein